MVPEVVAAYGKSWAKDTPGATVTEIEGAGMKLALRRYGECNFIFGLVVEAANNFGNSELAKRLQLPTRRLLNEPAGHYIQGFAPENHKREMSPLSTAWGYAIPRVVIEVGRNETDPDKKQKALLTRLEIIDQAVKVSKSPIELAARLSDLAVLNGADPKMVVYHLLSEDVRKEENSNQMYKNIIDEIKRHSPVIRRLYEAMTAEVRQDLGIVNF